MRQHRSYAYVFLLFLPLCFFSLQAVSQGNPVLASTDATAAWPMVAGNPARTSWTSEEVRGKLQPAWYKPFEAYISQKVQIITANDLLYISTSKGLYALNAADGSEAWLYSTELPLGNSPTIQGAVAYVGGHDRKLHAINALTGNRLWTFAEAKAGFQTNPLVVGGLVYVGNRDGSMYAIHAHGTPAAGDLAWSYETAGPILYSAAYKDGVIFFASNDSHAYALDALTGSLVWKKKLGGAGFYSWWPVVYGDRVIFSASNNYRNISTLGDVKGLITEERDDLYPNRQTDPKGTLIGPLGSAPGDWVSNTPTIGAGAILNYFAQKPWRRSVFVLDRFTGAERETAPVLWTGTHSGSRYPPVVGADGVLYQQNSYMSDPTIAGGQVAGWQPGVPHISVVTSDWGAVDEPHAYAAGGDLIYWNLCCDREAGAFDVTIPNTIFAERHEQGMQPPSGKPSNTREWTYFDYNLDQMLPGYNALYYNPDNDFTKPGAVFGGPNGVYGNHGDNNPPIPYKNKVYMHRSNVIIALSPNPPQNPAVLPIARIAPSTSPVDMSLGAGYLREALTQEIQEMLSAGHLRPGYASHGHFDLRGRDQCGDEMIEYWHNSAETIYTLIMALPYLDPTQQQAVKDYLKQALTDYAPYKYNHVGWQDGAARELFDLPPEIAADLNNHPPQQKNFLFENEGGWNKSGVWGRNPFGFYALWKYAEQFGEAKALFDASKASLESVPTNDVLLNMPFVHNAYIAGYMGYLELESLAGYAETAAVRNELNRLITLRTANFTKDSAYGGIADTREGRYCRVLNVSSNFIYLVPELATILRQNIPAEVTDALAEYEYVAPYWFVSFATEGFAENAVVPLYDTHAIFMAKALILEEPGQILEKYLDVPAFARGDLFYIQKLAMTLERSRGFYTYTEREFYRINHGESVSIPVYVQWLGDFDAAVSLSATNPASGDLDIEIVPITLDPTQAAVLTITDLNQIDDVLLYTIPITAEGEEWVETINVRVLMGGSDMFLPMNFAK